MKKIGLWKWVGDVEHLVTFDRTIVEAYIKIKFNNELTLEQFLDLESVNRHLSGIENMIESVRNNSCN